MPPRWEQPCGIVVPPTIALLLAVPIAFLLLTAADLAFSPQRHGTATEKEG